MSFQHILGRQQPGFIFGGSTGVSHEDLQRQRQAANQIRQTLSRTPQTFGEGLSALGQGFLLGSMNRKIAAREKAGREGFQSAFQQLIANKVAGNGANAPTAPQGRPHVTQAGPEGGNLSATSYARQDHAQPGGAAPTGPGPIPSVPMGGGIDPQLMTLMDNPHATEGQRAVMRLMLQRQMAASAPPDPMQALQRQQAELAVQRSQMELDRMRNPDRAIIQGADGFKYYQDTGERVLPGVSQGANRIVTGEAAEAYGLNPALSYNITDGPEGVRATQIGGSGTNVTVNNIPETAQRMGTIPQGYSAIPDPSNPSGYRMEAIPGGPEDTTREDAIAAEAKELSANIVLDEISISRDLISGQSWDSPATGMPGRAASLINSSRAGSLKNRLETIKANIGFDKLQAMRDASPTGGALGQVSDFENRLLQAVMGSLEQAQRAEDLLYNLDRLENIYGRIIHQGIPDQEARQIYRDMALGDKPDAPTDTQTGTDAPPGVEPELWQYMTPEEKALWQ